MRHWNNCILSALKVRDDRMNFQLEGDPLFMGKMIFRDSQMRLARRDLPAKI